MVELFIKNYVIKWFLYVHPFSVSQSHGGVTIKMLSTDPGTHSAAQLSAFELEAHLHLFFIVNHIIMRLGYIVNHVLQRFCLNFPEASGAGM